MFVKGKEIYKLKADNNNASFQVVVCPGSISKTFDYDESEEVSLKENVYDFSVNYDAADKSDN